MNEKGIGTMADPFFVNEKGAGLLSSASDFLERETGFEPATSTLARLHSTTELFPRDKC